MAGRFPLYKGATRVATMWGVPFLPLVAMVLAVAVLVMFFGFYWLALFVPGWVVMAQVTRTDDRAFRMLGLWAETKVRNRLRLLGAAGGRFWGASSYALHEVRGEETRWGG